jgi:hypothetical protein
MKKWCDMSDAARAGQRSLKNHYYLFIRATCMYWFPLCIWKWKHGLSGNPIGHTRIMGSITKELRWGLLRRCIDDPFTEIKYSIDPIDKFSFDLLAYTNNV